MAAFGPENSVPAMGCVAKKFRRFGWFSTALQIWDLVEPDSITKVSSDTKSKTFGNNCTVASTGIAIITISAPLTSSRVAFLSMKPKDSASSKWAAFLSIP